MFDLSNYTAQFEDDGFKYKPINDLLDVKFRIDSYKLFTSKDKEKYNSNNERGVMLNIYVNDEPVKTTTHSRVIVNMFESLKTAKVDIPNDVYFIIKRVTSESSGRNYFTMVQVYEKQ